MEEKLKEKMRAMLGESTCPACREQIGASWTTKKTSNVEACQGEEEFDLADFTIKVVYLNVPKSL